MKRTHILLVTDNELLAYAMTLATVDRAEITFVLTAGEALVRVARGEQFDLLLCSLGIQPALALHAAVACRSSRLAGSMLVFEGRQLRQVIELATQAPEPSRSNHGQIAGSANSCRPEL